MKKLMVAAALCLSSCASTPHPAAKIVSAYCAKDVSRHRGLHDAEEGRSRDSSFLKLCPEGEREAYLRSYREGFEAGRRQRHREMARPEVLTTPAIARFPASPSWACEVEASSKVFTGVGISEGEAASAAKEACGVHFQATACGAVECKKSL